MIDSPRPLRLSVLINNYNYGRFIEDCIQSVLNQSRAADEIIVVDDGSSDNSVEIISKFGNAVRLIEQPNSGQLSAMMTAAEAATGDVFLFLDSDDMWETNHLQVVEDAFQANPTVDCIFTCMTMFGKHQGPHGLNVRRFNGLIKCSRLISYYLHVFMGRPTSACAFRSEVVRKVFEACKGIEDYFKICGDKLIIDGTSLIGAEKLFIDDCTVLYRTHGNNRFFETGEPEKRDEQQGTIREKIIQKMSIAYPFDTSPQAVMREMVYNGSINLHSAFYQKIPQHMCKTYIGRKWLLLKLYLLKRRMMKGGNEQ